MAAERFGGPYSPGGRPSPRTPQGTAQAEATREALTEARRVDAAGARANLLFVPPVVAAFAGLFRDPLSLLLCLGAAVMLALGAWLLREGLRAQAAHEARPAARRPALPRKILAALLAAAGTALATMGHGIEPLGGLLYGLAAGGLHLAAFGIDPLHDKRIPGIDSHQQDRAARLATEAEGYLATIREQIGTLGDRALAMRVAGFEAVARRMIRTLEEDPRDLGEARRYLGVYLMGARDATVRFVDLYRRSRDARARADYEALLGDLEANYAGATRRLIEGGREALDIEITVLRERLQREGVSPNEGRKA
ncbi:hypothetical protein ruthe_00705 [Rubellimicrobium thermophilum DSM 16684]|uniref:5-bromo-4-chloroindolyl phosphate hydrolysis protein n=1 Tax=Rubellimicrobium thermophilum DSM 16684 TaxID=1123069 RepID=S9R0W7_9RHOB|nr:5-bromo-4-chloroindolyl phosphate hydrolysis family protein [Rubellimicrobium thermophilum]EPX87306.1 hypothetical protein ruthe_00705 [Rubellimicrobium thermophilum DSM 16684]